VPVPRASTVRTGGFTLVELLAVVIVLSILAAVVVPSFAGAGEDAKVSTLRADLARLRAAIERYAAEHGARVPGVVKATDGASPPPSAGACAAAALAQLTQYTNAAGAASGTPGGAFVHGPYLRGDAFPANPFLVGAEAGELVCDTTESDLTAAPTADGSSGWKLYVRTGRLVANDATVLSGGRSTLGF